MSYRIIATEPDGTTHKHPITRQTGEPEVRDLPDGSVQLLGVWETPAIKGQGGATIRAANRAETVLGTYPAGTTFERG